MIINVNECINKRRSNTSNSSLITCNNILEYYLNLSVVVVASVKNKKSCIKIIDEDFNIPTYASYSNILKIGFYMSSGVK